MLSTVYSDAFRRLEGDGDQPVSKAVDEDTKATSTQALGNVLWHMLWHGSSYISHRAYMELKNTSGTELNQDCHKGDEIEKSK